MSTDEGQARSAKLFDDPTFLANVARGAALNQTIQMMIWGEMDKEPHRRNFARLGNDIINKVREADND